MSIEIVLGRKHMTHYEYFLIVFSGALVKVVPSLMLFKWVFLSVLLIVNVTCI